MYLNKKHTFVSQMKTKIKAFFLKYKKIVDSRLA